MDFSLAGQHDDERFRWFSDGLREVMEARGHTFRMPTSSPRSRATIAFADRADRSGLLRARLRTDRAAGDFTARDRQRLRPDLPEELWEGDEITESIRRAGSASMLLDLLPAPFPIDEILSERDRGTSSDSMGSGGLSYGNISARLDESASG
jgi:hypothetical protein